MRWKLTESHYLNVPGTTWEQKETDRMTGKQVRKTYPVPLHLDVLNEADFNYTSIEGGEGGIVVCWEGRGLPRDIVFEGPPTPGMKPIDDEAREESAKYNWIDPINEFDAGMTYSEKLLVDLQGQVAQALMNGPARTESVGELKDVLEKLTEISLQNAQLLAEIAANRPQRRI
jgi:hypothetical protein